MRDGIDGRPVMGHALVPVANVDDARATAAALAAYGAGRTTVVHVVEKGGGVPDKTPVEQSESEAEAAFAAFRERFPDADTHVAYGSDVVEDVESSVILAQKRQDRSLRERLFG